MTNYTTREASWPDLEKLADRLHRADREYFEAANISPFRALQTGMDCSRPCMVGLADGEPICCFGVVPLADYPNEGGIWFMAAENAFEKHSVAILRRSSAWVRMSDYAALHNVSRADIPELVFWMGWMGFEVEEDFVDCHGFRMNRYVREQA